MKIRSAVMMCLVSTVGLAQAKESAPAKPAKAAKAAPSATKAPKGKARQFMVEQKIGSKEMSAESKLYFGKDMIRTEATISGQQSVVILDKATRTGTMMMPASKMFMKMPPPPGGMKDSSGDMMDVASGKDFCEVKNQKEAQCKKVGPEKLIDRDTTKYEFLETSSGKPQKWTVWIDNEIAYPLKMFSEDGMNVEVTKVVVGEQPANLFAVPKDYKELNMGGGMGPPGDAPAGKKRGK